MNEIDKFQLQPLPVKSGEQEKSRLIFGGDQTNTVLNGITLDVQFQHGERYVLFVTYDSLFSEALHIYLLNNKFEVIDEWQVSRNEASVRNVQIVGDNQVKFSFFINDSWTLTVLQKPQIVLPRLPLFSPYWKPLRFAFAPGYLQLQGG